MVLKADWDKTDEYVGINDEIINIVQHALPSKTLLSHDIISGGCANINIKLNFTEDSTPLILRIYIRDKNSALKEQKILELISPHIPVPKVYSIGEFENCHYALLEYIEGRTLRDVILEHEDTKDAMFEAGKILGEMKKITFASAGLFNQELKVAAKLAKKDCAEFLYESLKNPIFGKHIKPSYIRRIREVVKKHESHLPDSLEKHLVHADYDPSNILVAKQNNVWKVAAILDWEFSFSGSSLWDIANMLRYSHQLPGAYENEFLRGVSAGGIDLPEHWRITAHLLNLLALIDCLSRYEPRTHTNNVLDIKALIDNILAQLETTPS
ncbi:MAG: aminoglycoside phosphotransferase family protein [Rickettsiales bacterium]|jgi:aminoglycoside phosphotransferase (APT) family kinase protein|nr:aminoglycoside phosphotransferase family protein [Rickettsiales bacterium]